MIVGDGAIRAAARMMHTMADHTGGPGGLGVSVLPFDGMGLYEQPRPRLVFKMPRVVPDQKGKFESDELFRRLSRESEVGPAPAHLFGLLAGSDVRRKIRGDRASWYRGRFM